MGALHVRGIEVVGPIYGTTGYDRHTREFIRNLHALGVPLQVTPQSGWSPAHSAFQEDPLFKQLSIPIETSLALHFTMPTLCHPRADKRNVNYTMFEGDRLPIEWARRSADHELIVVPAQFCADAWIASGVPSEKLRVSPLGVNGEFFSRAAEPLALGVALRNRPVERPLGTYAFRFLNIAELRPRKNLLGLLRTWIRSTRASDDAVLILKCTSFVESDVRGFEEDLQKMQEDLGQGLQDAAPVLMLRNSMTDEEMRSLYHSATHYISMSYGEGWDLAMMEAACTGLELIAPRHTGYLAYLTERDAMWISATLEPAVLQGRLGEVDRRIFSDVHWWRPNEDEAAEILRQTIRGQCAARPPQQRIVREFTWRNAVTRLLEVILAEPG